VSVNI